MQLVCYVISCDLSVCTCESTGTELSCCRGFRLSRPEGSGFRFLLHLSIVLWPWDSWLWHESNKSCVTRLLWGSSKMMSLKHLAQCLLHEKCSVKRGLRLKYWLIIGFLLVEIHFNCYITPIYFVAHRRQLCLLSQRDLSLSLSLYHTRTHTHPKMMSFMISCCWNFLVGLCILEH